MGSAALGDAIRSIHDWAMTEGRQATMPARVSDIFGSLVFNDQVQQARLPKPAYERCATPSRMAQRSTSRRPTRSLSALKDWAIEQGASHFTHWFQPMTGITAEKHDSFYLPSQRRPIDRGVQRKGTGQGRARRVELPVGRHAQHVRSARLHGMGPDQPPWLLQNGNSVTLVIPTAFVSWTGEALDKKTPLLRSMEALSTQAVRVSSFSGRDATRVTATCRTRAGILPDRSQLLFRPSRSDQRRPDAVRRRPPKGQELEDQYFGSIPERVLACMAEVEAELYKVGVPVKTRHNEVAPSQYEIAPIFESANVATDHQMMTMEMFKRVAPKYGLACLMHEKPFAGVNGSGKHLNWSIADNLGNNLLNPGDTPHANMQFLFFCVAVIRAVDKWQGLLRMSIASAGNDHRLGANEAPPAILSVFLGDMLTDIFTQIETGGAQDIEGRAAMLDIGVAVLPKLPRDAGDRNRTSPFAFTGNKFEFRAVSSGQNVAFPATCLNLAVAESLDAMATRARRQVLAKGQALEDAVGGLVTQDHQAAQADHLQRQRLLGRNGRRKRASAGLLNLQEHRRRAARDGQAGRRQDLREVQGAQRARAARALRGQPRNLLQDDQRRSAVDGVDGQSLHPPGGARVSEAQSPRASAAAKAAGATSRGREEAPRPARQD